MDKIQPLGCAGDSIADLATELVLSAYRVCQRVWLFILCTDCSASYLDVSRAHSVTTFDELEAVTSLSQVQHIDIVVALIWLLFEDWSSQDHSSR